MYPNKFINIFIYYYSKKYQYNWNDISNIILLYSYIDYCQKCKKLTFNGNKFNLNCLICNQIPIFCFCKKKFNEFKKCLHCLNNDLNCKCCFYCNDCKNIYCKNCYQKFKKKTKKISMYMFDFDYLTTCYYCKKKICYKCNIRCMNYKIYCKKMICKKCIYNYKKSKYCFDCYQDISKYEFI